MTGRKPAFEIVTTDSIPSTSRSAYRGILAHMRPTSIAVSIQCFIYLQVLDFLTTMLGFKLGAAEASPFIRILMHAGPLTGVLLSKLLALALAAACLFWRKWHLLVWANYWYAGLVIWNLLVILVAVRIHA